MLSTSLNLRAILRIIPGLLTLAILCPQFCNAAEPTIDENPYFILMGEAEKAIADEKYEEAAARLIDAMAVEPNNPGNLLLMTNLGIVYS